MPKDFIERKVEQLKKLTFRILSIENIPTFVIEYKNAEEALRQSLQEQRKEIVNEQSIPMRVSQWLEYGKKYGYYNYFRDDIKKEIGEEFKSWYFSEEEEFVAESIKRITGIDVNE